MSLALIMQYITKAGTALLVIIVGRIIARLMVTMIKRLIIRQQGTSTYAVRASNIIGQIVYIIMMVFVLLFAIQSAGMNVSLLIGGFTFAIGYAMQETLGNLIAGIFILTNPKYKLGLLMEFMGDINTFGTLESVTLRNSIIRGFDKQAVIIPNMTLLSTPMKTFKMENLVRYKLSVYIERHMQIEKMQKLIVHIVNQHQYVTQKEHTTVVVDQFTSQGTQLAIYFFYDPQCGYSSFKTRSEIRQNIHQTFQQQGITIPYPKTLLETSKL